MNSPKLPTKPLERIAMTLSGGGYRAASFHLGAFDYLNQVKLGEKPLLQNVRLISTVSGGTICGALYAHMLKNGHSFEAYFQRMHVFMRDYDLIGKGLEKLTYDKNWEKHKRKNLINAFSQIYDRDLLDGATFKEFMDLPDEKVHLDEVIFNATEFKHGLWFRFQNEGYCGNKFINLNEDEKAELKLGDIVAASSCFPSGFEPLAFPHDFAHESATNLKLKCKYEDYQNGPVGLMDGGIVDNQGIQSALLSEKRLRRRIARQKKDDDADEDFRDYFQDIERQYDLMFVSDVSSPYMEQLGLAESNSSEFLESLSLGKIVAWLNKMNNLFRLFIILFVISAVFLGISLYNPEWLPGEGRGFSGGFAFLCGLFLLPVLGYIYFKRKIRNEINEAHPGSDEYEPGKRYQIRDFVPPYYQRYLPYFSKLNLKVLKPMTEDRVTSVLSMVNDVFMKQVRRLLYTQLYTDDNWDFRRLANHIYELRAGDLSKRYYYQSLDRELQHVSDQISAAAAKATSMGTTLWFTDEEKEDGMIEHLIACGQFATCYNLLEYLCLIRAEADYQQLDEQVRASLDDLWDQMMRDWRQFQKDPFFMLKEKEKAKLAKKEGSRGVPL